MWWQWYWIQFFFFIIICIVMILKKTFYDVPVLSEWTHMLLWTKLRVKWLSLCINVQKYFMVLVLNDGGLQPVLSLCWSNKGAISLLSIKTLGLIAEHPATHSAIFDNRQNAISRLLQLSKAPDEQVWIILWSVCSPVIYIHSLP